MTNENFKRIIDGLEDAILMSKNVVIKTIDEHYVIVLTDEDNKESIVPREICNLQELKYPSEGSIAYWKHYGHDRTKFFKDYF